MTQPAAAPVRGTVVAWAAGFNRYAVMTTPAVARPAVARPAVVRQAVARPAVERSAGARSR